MAISISALVSVSVFSCTALAEDFQTLDEYVNDVLPTYLEANDFPEGTNYYTSNLIDVINYETGDKYASYIFVFSENEIIGKMQINSSNNGFFSSFDTYIPDAIQEVYDKSEYFTITFDDNYVFLVTDSVNMAFDGVNNENIIYSGDAPKNDIIERLNSFSYVKPEVISLNNIQGDISLLEEIAFADYDLSVERVPNVYISDIGRYVCWAACIAMKLNYQCDLDLTATDIFNASKWLESGETDPGYEYVHKNAFDKYDCAYTLVDGSISASKIAFALRDNMPVEIGIEGTYTKNGKTYSAAHALIVKGIRLYTSKATFILLDPSTSQKQTVTIPGGAHHLPMSSFDYTKNYNDGNGVYTFTDIYYAYY